MGHLFSPQICMKEDGSNVVDGEVSLFTVENTIYDVGDQIRNHPNSICNNWAKNLSFCNFTVPSSMLWVGEIFN